MKIAALRTFVLTKLQNRRFLRNSGLLMLANMIVTGLALIRTPAMTWLLPKEGVGMIGVVAAWMPFLQLLSMPGMDSASYHYLAKGSNWAFATNLAYRLRWSILSSVGLLVGAGYWWSQGNLPLAWLFLITALTFPVTTGLSAAGGTLSATQNFGGLFWYRLGESLTDFIGFLPLLLSVWWVSQAVTFYAANQITTAVMMVGVSWWLLRRLRIGTSIPTAEEQRGIVAYGKHQTVISSIGVVQSRVDSLLVSAFFPLTLMADYSIGSIVANQFRSLWAIYVSIRYTPLVQMTVQRRRRRFLLEGTLIWFAFILTAVVVYLAAYWLIPLVLPPTYVSSIPYVGWLSAIMIIGMPGGIVETYFRTQQNEKPQYTMRITGAVTSLLFPALLMAPWGVTGIMVGRLLSNGIFSVLGLWLFARETVAPTKKLPTPINE